MHLFVGLMHNLFVVWYAMQIKRILISGILKTHYKHRKQNVYRWNLSKVALRKSQKLFQLQSLVPPIGLYQNVMSECVGFVYLGIHFAMHAHNAHVFSAMLPTYDCSCMYSWNWTSLKSPFTALQLTPRIIFWELCKTNCDLRSNF